VLSDIVFRSAKDAGAIVHKGGTFIAMEGPAFSTRAESRLYKAWGADVLGMTVLPEAKLAREAGICYAALACVTDYDVWRESYADVTAQMILDNLLTTVESARRAVAFAIEHLPADRSCACAHALDDALVTQPDVVPAATLRKLAPIIGDRVQVRKDGDGR
jgi:5'-methylthioadenosine phosphorylase